MRSIIAALAVNLMAGAAWAAPGCATLVFDYSSFTYPPQKLDDDRYVAGELNGYFLSLGLDGATLQISPANDPRDQQLPGIWEDWRAQGKVHPDYGSFHLYFEQPVLVDTPFTGAAQGYRSGQKEGGDGVIEFAFLKDAEGRVLASTYLNDPVGGADLDSIVAELAALMTVDPGCTADDGLYDGIYDLPNARFLIFPKAEFPFEGPITLP